MKANQSRPIHQTPCGSTIGVCMMEVDRAFMLHDCARVFQANQTSATAITASATAASRSQAARRR